MGVLEPSALYARPIVPAPGPEGPDSPCLFGLGNGKFRPTGAQFSRNYRLTRFTSIIDDPEAKTTDSLSRWSQRGDPIWSRRDRARIAQGGVRESGQNPGTTTRAQTRAPEGRREPSRPTPGLKPKTKRAPDPRMPALISLTVTPTASSTTRPPCNKAGSTPGRSRKDMPRRNKGCRRSSRAGRGSARQNRVPAPAAPLPAR